MHVARALTAAQAARFQTAMHLLGERKVQEALAVARRLVVDAADSADAQQLLGMSLAEASDPEGAAAAFRRALALAPSSPVVALNFAAFLARAGRPDEASAVLESVPPTAQTLAQLGSLALQRQDHPRARKAFEGAIGLGGDAAAWHGLGSALRGLGRLDAAADAFRRATALAPLHAPAWINLGNVLRLLGRIEDALACMDRARELGYEREELADAINGLLLDAGRPAEALAGARALVRRSPGYAPGQHTLANILWEFGPDLAPEADPLGEFRAAARARPGDLAMQLQLVRMLMSMRRPEDALLVLEPMRRREPGNPVLAWFVADALDALREFERASAIYASVAAHFPRSAEFLNAWTRHSFRRGMYDRARQHAGRAVELAPGNQEAWSNLGTAWRLLGDEREHWLFDYERLVGFVEVEPPAGFDDAPSFLAALTRVLESLHKASREPVRQSVRHGSQTPGRLFGRNDPTLRATEASVRQAVARWLAGLPQDDRHPFLGRARDEFRIVGSWSVRLKSSGRHANHIHNEGWMSSAFYVSLPPSVRGGTSATRAGWIQFGQPLEELGLDLPPRRLVRPEEGRLALFPSYMWHGTIPFEDAAPRLTIAFDAQSSDTG